MTFVLRVSASEKSEAFEELNNAGSSKGSFFEHLNAIEGQFEVFLTSPLDDSDGSFGLGLKLENLPLFLFGPNAENDPYDSESSTLEFKLRWNPRIERWEISSFQLFPAVTDLGEKGEVRGFGFQRKALGLERMGFIDSLIAVEWQGGMPIHHNAEIESRVSLPAISSYRWKAGATPGLDRFLQTAGFEEKTESVDHVGGRGGLAGVSAEVGYTLKLPSATELAAKISYDRLRGNFEDKGSILLDTDLTQTIIGASYKYYLNSAQSVSAGADQISIQREFHHESGANYSDSASDILYSLRFLSEF